MIGCKSNRKGIAFPLVEYRRKANRNLTKLWTKAGFNPIGRSRALLQIEAFVEALSRTHEPAFIIRHDNDRILGVHMTGTGKGLLEVLPLLGLFDSDHDYSEKPYAFLDACWMTENVTGIDLSLVWRSPHALILNYAHELNWLVDKLRMCLTPDDLDPAAMARASLWQNEDWWRAFKRRGLDLQNDLFYGGSNPLHLGHSETFGWQETPGAKADLLVDRSSRKAVLMASGLLSWRADLDAASTRLPSLGDRSWRVEVLDRQVGWLGEYRQSRETGRWFVGRHKTHMAGWS